MSDSVSIYNILGVIFLTLKDVNAFHINHNHFFLSLCLVWHMCKGFVDESQSYLTYPENFKYQVQAMTARKKMECFTITVHPKHWLEGDNIQKNVHFLQLFL